MAPHLEVVMEVHASIPARGAPTAPGLWRAIRSWAARALDRLRRWREVTRERRTLLALSDHMLKDIGITRAEAEREASRPFWQDRSHP
ncbi:MAG: DUF1127 domain-containing protein [Gammaproteobacteria bacterium]